MKVLAIRGKFLGNAMQFRHAVLRRADRRAILAARITAGLAGKKPELYRAREQAIRDVPQIALLVFVGDAIAEIHDLIECLVEYFVCLFHSHHRRFVGKP
jgi:hypothetical protein